MQNKNETNENVNKVVAEFFKSKPLAKQNNNHKRRPFHQRNDANTSQKADVEASVNENAKQTQSNNGERNKNGNFSHNKNRHHRHGQKFDRNQKNPANENATAVAAAPLESAGEIVLETSSKIEVDVDTESEIVATNDTVESVSDKSASSNDSENEWYDPNTPVEILGVRFKAGGKIYYFAPMGVKAQRGDNVIVETARGLEFGSVQIPNSTVKIKEVVMPLKNVVRVATPEDEKHHEENNAKVAEAMRVCNERIAVHNLEMKLVDVEYTFDNSKLLFYFTSEGRVDFRELVKDLAGIFKTRIELRQIGIREETKLLGGIGICGLPFCCKTFLNDFVQVSIKMAKEQGLSLNSAKISGACGRLMCCLRYEYDTYDEEIRKTPKVDTPVITPDGPGVISETQPLAGLCKVKLTSDDETIIKVYHRDDLKPAGQSEKKIQPSNDKTEGE